MIADDYKALLISFNEAFDRLEKDLAAIHAREKEIAPGNFKEWHQKNYILGEGHDFSSRREVAAKHVFRDLIRRAESEFAPPGARLSINASDIEEHFQLRDNAYKNLDPVEVWTYLAEEYGTKGEDIAYTQAADPIVSHFNIEMDQPIKTVGGQLVLEIRVWIDSIDKKFSNVNKLSYGCANNIYALCKALSGFATWADELQLSAAFLQFASNVSDSKFIDSRARYPLGNPKSPPVVVITYTTRYEFRFAHDLGVRLQEFLGLYASKFQQAA